MSLVDLYYQYVEETRDPRTITWPLMSVTILLVIYVNYFYFIFGCGPRYMKNRPAYDLRKIIRVYNVFQIIANFLLVYNFIDTGFFQMDLCKRIVYAPDNQSLKIASLMWWTYLVKIIDLVETFFFVLRKKNRQISFLHVHHHAMTVFLTWLGVRYYPGGLACFVIVLNCTVHVIMYTYYFLSSLNSTIQKMINPYKPVITGIQIVQLVIVLLYILRIYIYDCYFPRVLSVVTFVNIFINLYFFFDFFQNTYMKPKKKTERRVQ